MGLAKTRRTCGAGGGGSSSSSGGPRVSQATLASTSGLSVTLGSNTSAPVTRTSSNSSLPGNSSPPLAAPSIPPPSPPPAEPAVSTLSTQQAEIPVCSPSTAPLVRSLSPNVTVSAITNSTHSTGALDCNDDNNNHNSNNNSNSSNNNSNNSEYSLTPGTTCSGSLSSSSSPELSTSTTSPSEQLKASESSHSVAIPVSPALPLPLSVSTITAATGPTPTSTVPISPLSTSPTAESTGPRVRRRGTACAMPIGLCALQPVDAFRLPPLPPPLPLPVDPTPAATLGEMFDCRFPAQTHDTTSIYLAAQRRQRLQKEKEPTRRSSTNVPPTKSCLSPNSSRSEPTSPIKVKRKVSFADDKGLSLTEVRVMKNEINELPLWTQQLLFQSLPARSESTVISTWDPLFPQPASDYLAFRKRIEENNLALENVIVKKDDDLLTGTIKVKNIAFEKHVFVRATFDCWSSYCDYPAVFVSQGACPVPALFDTFSFSIKVPASASRYGIIEMCIGYKTPQGEYWDSNGGKNFKLASVTRRTSDNTSPAVAATQVGFIPPVHKLASYSASDIAGWTDFSSWNQILSQGPYW